MPGAIIICTVMILIYKVFMWAVEEPEKRPIYEPEKPTKPLRGVFLQPTGSHETDPFLEEKNE